MFSFIKINKSLIIYSAVLILIPIFGFNFLISLLSNFLIILILLPLLLIIITVLGFNSLKSRLNTCKECGAISLGINGTCIQCGSEFNLMSNINQHEDDCSDKTIDIDAEEV